MPRHRNSLAAHAKPDERLWSPYARSPLSAAILPTTRRKVPITGEVGHTALFGQREDGAATDDIPTVPFVLHEALIFLDNSASDEFKRGDLDAFDLGPNKGRKFSPT